MHCLWHVIFLFFFVYVCKCEFMSCRTRETSTFFIDVALWLLLCFSLYHFTERWFLKKNLTRKIKRRVRKAKERYHTRLLLLPLLFIKYCCWILIGSVQYICIIIRNFYVFMAAIQCCWSLIVYCTCKERWKKNRNFFMTILQMC